MIVSIAVVFKLKICSNLFSYSEASTQKYIRLRHFNAELVHCECWDKCPPPRRWWKIHYYFEV